MSALIAHSWFHLGVFYGAFVVCFGPDWYAGIVHSLEPGATIRDRGSRRWLEIAIGVGVFVAFGCTFGLSAATLARHQVALYWIGLGLMLAGLALRWYSIRVLGRFFTRTVATRAGQYVVDAGPYRWIRHPAYSGSLLMFLGMGLAMTNWAALLVLLAAAAIGYTYRVRVEERALCADLGQPYRDYMQRTRRFIPCVW